MFLLDTSVWIEVLRGGRRVDPERVAALLDAEAVVLALPVRIELLAGASRTTAKRLLRMLSALPLLVPELRTWQQAESWAIEAAKHGQHFGIMDLLIAALAGEQSATLWSLDDDFRRMAALGWIEVGG